MSPRRRPGPVAAATWSCTPSVAWDGTRRWCRLPASPSITGSWLPSRRPIPLRRATMSPFRNILSAADFSEISQEALSVACSLARGGSARLVVLHVIEHVYLAEEVVIAGQLGVPVVLPASNSVHRDALKERLRELYVPD